MRICRFFWAAAVRTAFALGVPASIAVGCASSAGEPTQRGAAESRAQLVFQDSWSETGRFSVYRFPNGTIAASITGATGKDDPRSAGRAASPRSIVDTYRHLKPGAGTPPDILAQVDREIETLGHRSTTLDFRPPPPIDPPAWGAIFFNNYICVPQPSHCGTYVPTNCSYGSNDNIGAGVFGYDNGDLSYFANDSDFTGRVGIGPDWTGFAPDYSTPIGAHSWGYTYWYGDIVNWWAMIQLDPGGSGPCGVTIHKFQADPC
jgi:hypothetical protein